MNSTGQSKRAVIEGLAQAKASNKKEWRDVLPTWCPGCGHFTVLNGLYEAIEKCNIAPKDLVVVSGIGCSGRFPFFIKGFGFHALHGRGIPVATGVKLANPGLTVVVIGGDGDGVGIGGGHFPHAARNNLNITYILLDNSIYGLTKGQISPTSPLGMKSATSPYGNISRPLNPTTLALSYGATFVGRVFSRNRDQVSQMILQALQHPGFSFVHNLSPCVEFNKSVTYHSVKDSACDLPIEYSPDDRTEALRFSQSIDPVYLGLYFKETIPTYEQKMTELHDSF